MSLTEVVVAALVLLGVSLFLVTGIGLQRFPDVFARMHAATKPATLGIVLVLAGVAVHRAEPAVIPKLVLVVVLQFATIPVAAHLVGRAAYRAGTELSADTAIDELDERGGQPTADEPG